MRKTVTARHFAVIALVAAGLSAGILACGDSASSSPSIGDNVLIETSGVSSIPVARDIATFNKMTDAVVANDKIGYAEAAASGGFMVSSGTSALVIDIGLARTRVRIQAGPYAGEVGWVPSEWVKKQ